MRLAKGATVYGLDATVRAPIRRVSTEEARPVRWPGVAVAVQKAAASMKIVARKIKPRPWPLRVRRAARKKHV